MALDQQLVTLAKAIRQQESGGNPTRKGASGEYGAYQFMPSTWASYAKSAGVNVPLEQATLAQQNEVAYKNLERMRREHPDWNVGNFASAWNAGEGKPNAYREGYAGKNSQGVSYDTPAYAKAVAEFYQQFKTQGGGTPSAQAASTQPTPSPEPLPNPRGALFQSSPNDSPVTAGLKTLGNVPSSLFHFAKDTISALNPISTAKRIFSEIPEAFNDLSNQKGGAGGAIKAGLSAAPQALYEGFVPEAARNLIAGDTQGAQASITENPVGNIAPLVLGARYGAQKAGVGAQFDSGISSAARMATAPVRLPVSAVGRAVGGTAKFAAAQATGLRPETLGTIAENPRAFTKENAGALDRKGVADEIKGALDQRIAALDETGSAYSPIRKATMEDTSVAPGTTKKVNIGNGQTMEYSLKDAPNELLSLPELRAKLNLLKADETVPAQLVKAVEDLVKLKAKDAPITAAVKVDPNWLERAIRETTGLGVRNGKIVAKPSSSVREARDVTALQKTYDLWRPAFAKGRLTNEEFLNFRKDMAGLAKFDREVSRSAPLQNLSGIIRGKFNSVYRGQIKGLQELDESFATQISDLQRLRKGLIDKDGNLTTSAISRVANAINRGKDLELARLEEILPGITKKIRIVKALEDIEDAKAQKVGTYVRGGLIVGGALTLNIPAIVAAIVSTPELAVPILRQYGYAKPLVDTVVKGLKASAGGQGDFGKLLDRPVSIPKSLPQLPQRLMPRQ